MAKATETQIKRLVTAGGVEWNKGVSHYVYFNAEKFGELFGYPNSDFYFDCSNCKVYFKNGKSCKTAEAKKVQEMILGFANTEVVEVAEQKTAIKIEDLQDAVNGIKTISGASNKEIDLFYALKEGKLSNQMIDYIEKTAGFGDVFIVLCAKEKEKQNRVLMTFKTLNEMNAFIKAGNECGASWWDSKKQVNCLYCYEFVAGVTAFKTKKDLMIRAWFIAKQAVVDFGGSAKQYLAEAMKLAWSEVKNF